MADFDLLSLAREMIAIDSVSTVSNGPLIEFLVPLCRAAGLEVTVQEESWNGLRQCNLLASRRPIDGRGDTLLLNAHLDTVAPGDPALWTETGGDPFTATERDGLLYGLGVADVKLDFLCKLLALASVGDFPLDDNVALVGTYGEELGGHGARLLVRELGRLTGGNLPSRIMVGEPSSMRPSISHKGYTEFRTEAHDADPVPVPALPCWRLVFRGTAAHSSQPHRGASANTACLDALALVDAPVVVSINGGDAVNKVAASCEALVLAAERPDPVGLLQRAGKGQGITCEVEPAEAPDGVIWSAQLVDLLLAVHSLSRRLERRLRSWNVAGFEPAYSTVNNGVVVLEQGRFTFAVDVRRVEGDLPAGEVYSYEEAVQALGETTWAKENKLRVSTERLLETDPFRAVPRSELLGSLMVCLGVRGLPVAPALKSGATEAPIYHEAGMEVIIFGPGVSMGNIHRPNEHVPLSDLYDCVDIYRDLVLRTCRR